MRTERIEQPYHEGELLVQERAGELAQGERNGRVISRTIIQGVPDFDTGRCLQIVGRPEIRWNLEDPGESGGTRRFWDLHVEEWICTDMPDGLQWEFLDRSPHNPELTEG